MPEKAPETTRPRRLPQARSLATRRKLLDATVETLVERGHARTTTTEVCRRARVSQGALFKHFPCKADLLGASVRHLFAGLVDDFRRAFAAAQGEADRLGSALGVLRDSFRQPRLLAAFELYAAARTDDGLREVLAPVMAEHRANLLQEARRVFGRGEGLETLVELVISTLQGEALGALVLPDDAAEARSAALLERLARSELARV